MPRPCAPPPVSTPEVASFNVDIDASQKRDLAKVLGLNSVSPEICGGLTHAVACYQATKSGSRDTTVGNTLAALEDLKKKGATYRKAVERLADDHCGVDYTTHQILQPLAKAVLGKEHGAQDALAQAAGVRAEELRKHSRVETETESLRYFCGIVALIFNSAADPTRRRTVEEAMCHCRKFAMEVFTVYGIDTPDFGAHPERLAEYLGTDVVP